MKKFILLAIIISTCLCSTSCVNPSKQKIKLVVPTGISFGDDYTVYWDFEENAKGYTIEINGSYYYTEKNFFVLDITSDVTFKVRVKAHGRTSLYKDSDFSQYEFFRYDSLINGGQ